MKHISILKSALKSLLLTLECEVRKPVARSPEADPWAPFVCEWYAPIRQDKYWYEFEGPKVFGFYRPDTPWVGWAFPWGGPGSMVQIKGTEIVCEITNVEVLPARKRFNWSITLKLPMPDAL